MDQEIRIVRTKITRPELAEIAARMEWMFVKGVVDIRRNIMAVGAELHVEEETALLEDGSAQGDLWGINLHPSLEGEDWVEFDSMINIRPWQKNRSRGVEDADTRMRLREVVVALVS